MSLENIQASLNSASKSNKGRLIYSYISLLVLCHSISFYWANFSPESRTSQWFDHDPENLSLEDSPDSPAKLPDGNHSNRMSMLSEILIKTANSDAIVSSSIHELINLLEVLPSQALMAMDRKLKNVTAVPQFAAPLSCRRSLLIKRLKKHCEKILLKTKPGGQLTVPLAKALSILCLAVKVKTRRTDFLTRKLTFFPFNEEINALQNEIVAAIWAIPRLRPKVWKQLHHLFTPNIEFSRRFFCKSLNNYLMECLFNCDDLELPGQLTMAVEIINKKIRCHVSSVKSAEEELESVLHLSSQLRQIISESLPDCDADKEYERYIEGLGIKDTSTIKTIDMDCSLFSIHDSAKISLAFSDQVEGSGDSMLDEPHLIIDAKGEDHGCLNLDVKNWYQELINICDDASLIAHKIIGRLLDELKRQEGCNLEG